MKTLLVALTLAFTVLFWRAGQAHEVGYGLICNEPSEVRQYAQEFDGDTVTALTTVNAQANVCGVLHVIYEPQGIIEQVQTKDGPANIVKILVVAINLGMGWIRAPPLVQYTLMMVEGRSA